MTNPVPNVGPLIVALPGNEAFATRLAAECRGDNAPLHIHHFPDDESCVRLDAPVRGRDVILVASLRGPDAKFIPLALAADAAHDLGAARVGLVAPYLAYMRQDTRFHDGEAVSARTFARLLSSTFDWLVTVDPHLHRVSALSQIYTIPAIVVHAAPALGAWIAAHVANPLIVGPDSESLQWATAVATAATAPVVVAQKVRHGDDDVSVTVPDAHAYHGRTAVLVDDIIATGRTMVQAITHLREVGFAEPVCVGVHAVFAPGAWESLRIAGAYPIVTTNTIPHSSNAIDVAAAIAAAIPTPA